MKQVFEKKELTITAVEKTGFHGFPMMFHPHMELLCVQQGSIRVNVDGTERILGPGELCAVFPYVLHSYEDAPDARFRLILFSPQYVSGLENNLFQTRPEKPFFPLDPTMSLLMDGVLNCAREQEGVRFTAACGYLTALVAELLLRSTLTRTGSERNTTIQNILVYCSEHFTEDINVKQVAEACFVSESYLSKLFTSRLGCSFRSYINALRISHARRLLEKTDNSITQVMYACGFRNQSSFNRIFLEASGKTPRRYRKDVNRPISR